MLYGDWSRKRIIMVLEMNGLRRSLEFQDKTEFATQGLSQCCMRHYFGWEHSKPLREYNLTEDLYKW